MKQHFRYMSSSVICCFPYKLYLQISIIIRAPKRALVSLQGKYKILQLYPPSHSFFYNETQNFENCNQTAIHVFTMKY